LQISISKSTSRSPKAALAGFAKDSCGHWLKSHVAERPRPDGCYENSIETGAGAGRGS
jgi:hypothetical protein